jgi:O-antigen ligase
LILSFFVLKFWMDEKTTMRYQTFTVVMLMIAGMFLFSYIYKKMDDPSAKITDRWERVELWESAIKANPNVWFGVGTGDYKKELNQYYIDHQMPAYARESYNAHNQFLQILFSNGIIGLIAVLTLLVRPLYLSIQNQNVLGALTFFPFLIYGMTEVFLGRFQGVVFFALLHQAFIALYANNRPRQNIL